MIKRILITGASGLVGTELGIALKQKGYEVYVLSRNPQNKKNTFKWDIYKQEIDPKCIDEVDSIVHLAGENIAEKRWTETRKKEIIDSRVLSTELLLKTIKESPNQVKSFISASAVGYYGDCGDEILHEDTPKGYGFLADCCHLWEDAVDHGKALSLRTVKLRTGFVLSKHGGGLEALAKPIKYFAGSALGSGKQWVPWIHINDLVSLYLEAIENTQMEGVYNACAPNPATNLCLTKHIAKQLHRPTWSIHVSQKALRFLMGEMSEIALMSTNVSAQKILDAGFKFRYTQLADALKSVFSK